MGELTTHVLDTTRGLPGSNIKVTLYRVDGDQRRRVISVVTNNDGRCDTPLLKNDEFVAGVYELVFSVGSYFAKHDFTASDKPKTAQLRFLDDVVIRFGVSAADQHYHVPLLVTPYSYSTYRGS